MNADCTFWQDRMLESNRITADEYRALARHIDACGECARILQEIREMQNLLAQFAELPVPGGFAEKVTAAACRGRKTPESNRVLTALAALLAVEITAVTWAPLQLGALLDTCIAFVAHRVETIRLAAATTFLDASSTVTLPFRELGNLSALPLAAQWGAVASIVLILGFMTVVHAGQFDITRR
ncbi:MAG: hypothetical protein GXP31_00070 [Kiritimatiellaeota bacterium]|nr:hypothetical protein [Kiritimatiellota bacterium]